MEHIIQSSLIPAPIIWRDIQDFPAEGKYPELRLKGNDEKSMLVFATDSSGIPADQYRTVVKRLVSTKGIGHRLLITSPGAQDGKSTSAANLAWSLSERGNKVLLMEFDLRRPRFREIFGASPARVGLEAVLRGDSPLEDSICRVSGTSLYLSSVVKPQEDAAKILQTHYLKDSLTWAQKQFDWLVFDAPPVLPVSDVVELTSHTDSVLMIVRARSTKTALLKRAIHALGESLHFVVVNDSNANTADPYKYYGNYEIAGS